MRDAQRSRARGALAAVALLPLLLLAACGGGSGSDTFDSAKSGDSASSAGGTVVIGGQNYTEMQIMSAMYAALLKDAGYDVTVKSVSDRALYAKALEKGTIDLSADYASSMTEFLNKDINGPDAAPVASPDIDETIATLTDLGAKVGVEPLEPAKAQDANAFAVTKDFAEKNDVSTMSELGALGEPIVLAAAPDCPDRTDCAIGLEKVYGLDITKVEPLGFGTVQTKNALKSGEVQLGQVGTSDGSLESLGLVVLEDDKSLQNAENLVPVVNSDFLAAHQDVADILNKLSATLTTDDLMSLNASVDVDRLLPEDVATSYLKEKGLL